MVIWSQIKVDSRQEACCGDSGWMGDAAGQLQWALVVVVGLRCGIDGREVLCRTGHATKEGVYREKWGEENEGLGLILTRF